MACGKGGKKSGDKISMVVFTLRKRIKVSLTL